MKSTFLVWKRTEMSLFCLSFYPSFLPLPLPFSFSFSALTLSQVLFISSLSQILDEMCSDCKRRSERCLQFLTHKSFLTRCFRGNRCFIIDFGWDVSELQKKIREISKLLILSSIIRGNFTIPQTEMMIGNDHLRWNMIYFDNKNDK